MAATRKPNKAEAVRASLGAAGKLANTQKQYNQSTTDMQEQYKQHTKKRYDIRLDPTDWEALGSAATAEGTSRGAIIRRLVKQFLT